MNPNTHVAFSVIQYHDYDTVLKFEMIMLLFRALVPLYAKYMIACVENGRNFNWVLLLCSYISTQICLNLKNTSTTH